MGKYTKIVEVEAVYFSQENIKSVDKTTISATGDKRPKSINYFESLEIKNDRIGNFILYPYKSEFLKVYENNWIVTDNGDLEILSDEEFNSKYTKVELEETLVDEEKPKKKAKKD